MEINKIKFREDLYPRFELDQKKIQEYSENIDKLPPIVINQNNELIDGWHRIKAHRQAKLDEIDVKVEKTKSDNELYLRAIELNATHGLQLSYKDKQSISVKLYDGKNADRLSKALSVSERTFRGWTTNKRKQIEEERNEQIINLYLKCWTQQRIADEFNMDKSTISKFITDFEEKLKIGKIAENQHFTPFLYNIWSLGKDDSGSSHFGKFPQIFMENLLYYYTKPLDIIYDPFAGGGVTIDACKKWFRRYYVSDIFPIPAREEDIKKWKIQDGLPKDLPSPNFIFLDPPYWKQAEGKYSKDKNDLGNMSLDGFYTAIGLFVGNLKKKVTEGCYVAFVIQPTQWKNNKVFEDHIIKIINIFEKQGFKEEMRYLLPYSTQQYNAQMVEIAKKEKLCLNILRGLVVFKK